jgi:DNA-binding cell septation regulator SpoVG
MNSILIKEWRAYQKNTLQGFFSVTLPSGLVIRDLTLHTKGDSRWVGMPAKAYKKDGVESWVPVIEFVDRQTANDFRDAVLEALDASGLVGSDPVSVAAPATRPEDADDPF